jgi:DNA polymerase elongation subunit (family B)
LLEGWLFDCYPDRKEGMTFWIKQRNDNGRVVRLHDSSWKNRIYAATTDDPNYVSSRIAKTEFVRSVKSTYRRADIRQQGFQKVLEIELSQADRTRKVAESLESIFQNPLTFQLYNIDILPEQTYFYEKEIFPLGFVRVETSGDQITSWQICDNVESTDYALPDLKILGLDITISSKIPKFDSHLEGISLSYSGGVAKFEGSEREIIEKAHGEIQRLDPDIIATKNGDLFALPYLYSKAQKLEVNFNLNRDTSMKPSHLSLVQPGGTTFFSYGRTLFKAKMQKLFGRVHLDEANTFVFDQCRLAGLYEITRLCRMPLQNSVRASIGKCLSSLQFYYASKKGILIPWKPWIAEDPKTFRELLFQDRGGLVLEPLPGIHEHVGEIDFASLYPAIICKYNISAETLNCSCCSESGHKIHGLGLHICAKEKGIVAESLKLPLDKRFAYRKLRDSAQGELRKNYNERAASLKWILVCCLAKESPVLVERDGRVEYVQIGKFIDGIAGEKEGIINCPGGISVAGIGHDFKSKFCKVKKLFKVPNQQKLLSIMMDDGRRIILTPNHPCYLLKNGKLEIRQAADLREGNFIPFAKRLPSPVQNGDYIDVIDESIRSHDESELGRWRVSGSILSQILLENKKAVLSTFNKLDKGSVASFANTKEMFQQTDLGFARIRKIERLDGIDDYVYCFQLEDDEVPGFFTGDGAVFTHNCFGYLSYRNAKFGKIDSHIAVCGYARKTLLQAMRIAEKSGHRVVHGIVDSLWLSKSGATREDYLELCDRIYEETQFKIVLEGIYKWIVFLPSKTDSVNQVANRYFGCFEDSNEVKVRGVEYRRGDAPSYFKECQSKIFELLSKCDNSEELKKSARTECVDVFEQFARKLEKKEVCSTDLLITRRISKNLEEYRSQRQLSVNASLKLAREGLKLQAGQSVSYVITRYKTSGKNRASPEELAGINEYDSERYIELLADSCSTVLTPFGVTRRDLLTRSRPLI